MSRLDYMQTVPKGYRAMSQLESYVRNSDLERSLLELVKLRASQINGCAFCIDMHTRDAREHGESEQRLYLLSAWRETTLYSERERAALAWTEALTLIAETHVPDEVYEAVRPHFSDEELINLSIAITTINAWNRLSVAFRTEVGIHRPQP